MGLFDNFKNLGEALQNFNKSKIDSDKDDIPDSEEKTSTEELGDFLKAKEEYEPTEYQKQLGEMEDYSKDDLLYATQESCRIVNYFLIIFL